MLPPPRPRQPDSAVVLTLREYRAQMDAADADLIVSIGKKWLEMERRLDSDIVALAYEIERRQKAGEVITEQMIRKAERYQALKREMAVEIAKYNKEFAAPTISAAQGQFANLGISAANDAILASYPGAGALSHSWTRINVRAVENMIGFAGDGSPLGKLLKAAYPDAVDGLTTALVNGLARGLGPAEIGRQMADGMGMGLDRALLIARTEVARAYRMGSAEQYRASGVVVKFKRLVKKETACPACLALDGEVFDTADELDDHPRGMCQLIPWLEGLDAPTWQTGPEWFAEQPEARQREILGPGHFALYQDGMPLSEMTHKNHSAEWGDSPAVIPLKDLEK